MVFFFSGSITPDRFDRICAAGCFLRKKEIDPVLHEAAEMRLKISACSHDDVSKSLVSYQ